MNFPWQALIALGKEGFGEIDQKNLAYTRPTNLSKKQLAKSAVERGTSTQSAI